MPSINEQISDLVTIIRNDDLQKHLDEYAPKIPEKKTSWEAFSNIPEGMNRALIKVFEKYDLGDKSIPCLWRNGYLSCALRTDVNCTAKHNYVCFGCGDVSTCVHGIAAHLLACPADTPPISSRREITYGYSHLQT
jgi:hypothetical protein